MARLRCILLFMSMLATTLAASADTSPMVYFGTYTRTAPSQGIYVARFDKGTGTLGALELAAAAKNPTFLARHPTLPVLYSVANSPEGKGVVIAYQINREDGSLEYLNQLDDGATNGTHISVTPDGRTLLTAHYTGGYLNTFSLGEDGKIKAHVSHIEHSLTGAHSQQVAPHPHCIDVSPDGRFAFVADLAADRIFAYRIEDSQLVPTVELPGNIAAKVPSGAGVRHLAFSTDARFLYAINELAATLIVYAYDQTTGGLREIQTVSTVPEGFGGRLWGAEIAVHPTGKYLYASNRADDESIAVFSIDQATGRLRFEQRVGGFAHPRHFAIDPTGAWLLCANHDKGNIAIHRIDLATGRLSEAPISEAKVPTCVCVLFWPGK